MRSINIFTDASIIKTSYGETIGCAGAICSEYNNVFSFEVQRDSTNNISEITAIRLAIELALQNREKFDIVNIWADSQWAIYSLTKWIKGWTSGNYHNTHIMINSSGTHVKNQQIILSIIKLIVNNNLKVNFFHTKGHVDVNSFVSINNACRVFNNSNNATISRHDACIAANMNNKVDKATRDILQSYKNEERVYLQREGIQPILSKEDLIRYYNLVTLGGNKI